MRSKFQGHQGEIRDKLKTDKSRAIFSAKAFGEADLDTIKGLKTLLGGDSLAKVGEFSAAIRNAGGTIERDLPEAIARRGRPDGPLKTEPARRPMNSSGSMTRFKTSSSGAGQEGKRRPRARWQGHAGRRRRPRTWHAGLPPATAAKRFRD